MYSKVTSFIRWEWKKMIEKKRIWVKWEWSFDKVVVIFEGKQQNLVKEWLWVLRLSMYVWERLRDDGQHTLHIYIAKVIKVIKINKKSSKYIQKIFDWCNK